MSDGLAPKRQLLTAARVRRGDSQEQLAVALGLSPQSKSWISKIEAGIEPAPIKLALQIEQWSDGEVSALELVSPEDRALLESALHRRPTPAPQGVAA